MISYTICAVQQKWLKRTVRQSSTNCPSRCRHPSPPCRRANRKRKWIRGRCLTTGGGWDRTRAVAAAADGELRRATAGLGRAHLGCGGGGSDEPRRRRRRKPRASWVWCSSCLWTVGNCSSWRNAAGSTTSSTRRRRKTSAAARLPSPHRRLTCLSPPSRSRPHSPSLSGYNDVNWPIPTS